MSLIATLIVAMLAATDTKEFVASATVYISLNLESAEQMHVTYTPLYEEIGAYVADVKAIGTGDLYAVSSKRFVVLDPLDVGLVVSYAAGEITTETEPFVYVMEWPAYWDLPSVEVLASVLYGGLRYAGR